MKEEIIKEVQNKSFIPDSYCEEHISLEDLFEILDKYDNQPDYKSAFEYMYKWFNQKNNKIDTEESLKIEKIVIDFMNEMIKKYNLGGE